VKSNEGSTVPDYFDIPYSLNRKPKNTSHALSKASKKIDDDDVEIDIDFNENITPGKFCYIICIYDTTGNISEPIEVCVEVESWGGNPNLTGTWNFTKRVRDGVTEFSIGGGECDSASIICEDDTELEIENAYCDVLTSLPITFNADGTYTSLETGTYTRYDYNLSIESCTVVLEEEQDETYTSKGNWAYDEEEQKLTLVEFEYAEGEGDETYEGTEENGYVLFDGKATITNSSLIVELDYESDEIEGTTYLAEFHFEK